VLQLVDESSVSCGGGKEAAGEAEDSEKEDG